jgi:MSHA biogenesis protein MshP
VKIKQNGFSLVAAIFILVVLALLGSYMVRLAGTQRTTTLYAIQGARAYQAARAGLEWAGAKINADSNCGAVNGTSLTFPGIDNFAVTLSCSSQPYTEVNPMDVYFVTSTSEYGTFTQPDYVHRKLEVSLVR